jgi:hypothetical protein
MWGSGGVCDRTDERGTSEEGRLPAPKGARRRTGLRNE